MTHEQAIEEARARNLELGRQRISNRYWDEVEQADGSWDVVLRVDPPDTRPWWKKTIEAIANNPTWP